MSKHTISSISAYTIFDSRGRPTVEAEVALTSGIKGYGMVPSGASKGTREAIELRDGDGRLYKGMSVSKAVNNIEEKISPALAGLDVTNQATIDQIMIDIDGTKNKGNLGANATLAVSMACSIAAAQSRSQKLVEYLSDGSPMIIPLPEIQIFGGGAHSAGRIDLQDFMIMVTGAKNLAEVYQTTFDIYHAASSIFSEQGKMAGVADEGGLWPMFDSNEDGLRFLTKAIERAGYQVGSDVCISLDIAATEFYHQDCYFFGLEDEQFTSTEFAQKLSNWLDKYAICSLEDPFAETDFSAWASFNAQLGDQLQIVGDDLFTTNTKYIQKGIDHRWANSVLIKPNQIGTITETLQAIQLVKQAGWRPIVSARSGETEDTYISHLAVATGAGQLKVGSFTRSERMAKWNELIRIERYLGAKAQFANECIAFPWSK